jgi:hypothetical protein
VRVDRVDLCSRRRPLARGRVYPGQAQVRFRERPVCPGRPPQPLNRACRDGDRVVCLARLDQHLRENLVGVRGER